VGDVLTGKTAYQDIHRLDISPVDLRDVAEVRSVWPVVGEDSVGVRVDLGVPDNLTADRGLDSLLETAVQ